MIPSSVLWNFISFEQQKRYLSSQLVIKLHPSMIRKRGSVEEMEVEIGDGRKTFPFQCAVRPHLFDVVVVVSSLYSEIHVDAYIGSK